ncbi:hypothetical protein [Nocardioides sp. LML1-1-1.1]|uniref:hypothetical protein n=1 Tax=Nocardioides sp. LML1-1-1.1 TaxID=3135248 RepID=UPI003431523B
MAVLVTFLFVFQLLVGSYMYGSVLGAGQWSSNARATRIPDLVAFVHPLAAVVTLAIWVGFMVSDRTGFAWATFVALLLTASGGAVMGVKTMRGSAYVDRPARNQGVLEPGDPAEIRVAEKQIPSLAILLHGGTFVLLALGTLLVALGV